MPINTDKDQQAGHRLEQELQGIWQQAANTRKFTSQRRIEHILQNSRSELALRDLLQFALHVLLACMNLSAMFLQAAFTPPSSSTPPRETRHHE